MSGVIPYTTKDGLHPIRAHADDAAFDLKSAEECYLFPGERYVVSTQLRIALPNEYCAFVLPRSGLAAKHGITILNSPGLIDAGYRGIVGVTLWNTGSELPGTPRSGRQQPFYIAKGERIAQLLVTQVGHNFLTYTTPENFEAWHSETERGEGGFGSTGR